MQFLAPLERRALFATYAAANVTELIDSIAAATGNGQADTITLAAGKTFSLSQPDNATYGGNAFPVVAAKENLTIVGNGSTIERSVAATAAFRLFDVAPGGSLTLTNLTLQGGLITGGVVFAGVGFSATPAQGGAILGRGSLALDGVVVQNNTARGTRGGNVWGAVIPAGDAAGGGVFSTGVLAASASTIRNNAALGGGGGEGGYSGVDSPVIRWSAGPGGNGRGGGVCVASGSASVTSSSIYGNTARGGDGGSANGMSNTVANGGNGWGGGVYAGGGNLALRHATLIANISLSGAGGIGTVGRNGSRADGKPGKGIGGGLYVDVAAAAGLDAFTKNHLKENTASTSHNNILGTYTEIV